MENNKHSELVRRLEQRRHTALVGVRSGQEPEFAAHTVVIRVPCDRPWATRGPMDDLGEQLEWLLTGEHSLFEQARDRVFTGLRKRLLGEQRSISIEAAIASMGNRLEEHSGARAVILMEQLDKADEATVSSLQALLGRKGWLKLPMVMTLAQCPKDTPLAALLDTLRAQDEGCVIELNQGNSQARPNAPKVDLKSLGQRAKRVLRAASIQGPSFEAALVAELLETNTIEILEALQEAFDAGVALEDNGDGRATMPMETYQALRASMLPSLRGHWHMRMGQILGQDTEEALEEDDESTTLFAEPPTQAVIEPMTPLAQAPKAPPSRHDTVATGPPAGDYAEVFSQEEIAPLGDATALDVGDEALPNPPLRPHTTPTTIWARPAPPARITRPERAVTRDKAMAAQHLHEAGEPLAAVERFLEAAVEVAQRGDCRRAYLIVGKALDIASELPPTRRNATTKARCLMEMARLQWQGSAMGHPFTLQNAMESLQMARQTCPTGAEAELFGELAALFAHVSYDLGDKEALETGLTELTRTSRLLMERGEPVEAARLLNDQASLYVRLGDPVQAVHLLGQSREIFEALHKEQPHNPVAVRELAETEHLLARLPLYARARPGREDDAWWMGLDHAISAEQLYQQLSSARELGRVWETMGRLEFRRGRLEQSMDHLERALDHQKELGDIAGLARTSASMAELLLTTGNTSEALDLLDESINLNAEKGSPSGLAFNRRTFGHMLLTLQRSFAGHLERLRPRLMGIEERLSEAETVLGVLDGASYG